MLYIKNLIIMDEYDNVIYKAKRCKAEDGLREALNIIKHKSSSKESKGIIRRFLYDLDKEFEEYFKL